MNLTYTLNGTMVLFTIPIYILIRIMFIKKQKVLFLKEILKFIIFINILFIIGLNLFPINIPNKNIGFLIIAKMDVNLIPFKSIIYPIKPLLYYLVGNLFLLIPIGFFTPIMYEKYIKIKNYIFFNIIFSIVLELFKVIEYSLNFAYGSLDINDIILNIIGISIGYFIYSLISKYNPFLIEKLTKKLI